MHVYLEWKRQEPSSLTSLDHSARITFSCMAYAPRLNRGAPKWPDSPLRLSISSGRQRKLHPRTAPTPFSISSLTSSGGGCLLSLTSTRVLSHSDARARFEQLHISRQGCCCGVTGTLSYMDAGFIFKYTGASKRSLDTQEWPHTSDTTLSAYRHSWNYLQHRIWHGNTIAKGVTATVLPGRWLKRL